MECILRKSISQERTAWYISNMAAPHAYVPNESAKGWWNEEDIENDLEGGLQVNGARRREDF